MQSQWRHGFNGPTGLDYGAAYPLLDILTDDRMEWLRLLDDLRAMEGAALEQMRS